MGRLDWDSEQILFVYMDSTIVSTTSSRCSCSFTAFLIRTSDCIGTSFCVQCVYV